MKKCTRCGLISSDEATRRDCGYDFELHRLERPYFGQRFPRDLQVYLTMVVIANIILAALALLRGDLGRVVALLFWSGLVYWLYSRLPREKKLGARGFHVPAAVERDLRSRPARGIGGPLKVPYQPTANAMHRVNRFD